MKNRSDGCAPLSGSGCRSAVERVRGPPAHGFSAQALSEPVACFVTFDRRGIVENGTEATTMNAREDDAATRRPVFHYHSPLEMAILL